MDIYEKIINHLREEYSSGATYQELASKYGVSYTHIHNLLNGKRAVSGISLDFLFRLFPKAQINLHGDAVSIAAPQNRGNVVGVNHGSVATDCLSGVMNKILSTEELTAEEKVKVLKVLQK